MLTWRPEHKQFVTIDVMAKPRPETHKRTLVKSVIFRVVVVTSDTTVIYLLTHKVTLTFGLTVATNLASMTLYYIYERIWNGISWGRR